MCCFVCVFLFVVLGVVINLRSASRKMILHVVLLAPPAGLQNLCDVVKFWSEGCFFTRGIHDRIQVPRVSCSGGLLPSFLF